MTCLFVIVPERVLARAAEIMNPFSASSGFDMKGAKIRKTALFVVENTEL
jgi:hypothetical protein